MLIDNNPQVWMDSAITADFLRDERWMTLVDFFVVRTPCSSCSAQGVSMQADYKWENDVWGASYRLEWVLNYQFSREGGETFKRVEMRQIEEAAAEEHLSEEGWQRIPASRAVFTKSNSRYGSSTTYMSLFLHLRNAFAHGRFTAIAHQGEGLYLAFEDGWTKNGDFHVNARGVVGLDPLLSLVRIIKDGPDGSESIYSHVLDALRNGCTKKSEVQKALCLTESEWRHSIKELHDRGLVSRAGNAWRPA